MSHVTCRGSRVTGQMSYIGHRVRVSKAACHLPREMREMEGGGVGGEGGRLLLSPYQNVSHELSRRIGGQIYFFELLRTSKGAYVARGSFSFHLEDAWHLVIWTTERADRRRYTGRSGDWGSHRDETYLPRVAGILTDRMGYRAQALTV